MASADICLLRRARHTLASTDIFLVSCLILLPRHSQFNVRIEGSIKTGMSWLSDAATCTRRLDPQLLFTIVVPEIEPLDFLIIVVKQLLVATSFGSCVIG